MYVNSIQDIIEASMDALRKRNECRFDFFLEKYYGKTKQTNFHPLGRNISSCG